MRRGLSIFLLSILFFSALAIAEEDSSKEDLDAKKGGLDNKTENVLERKVDFPTYLDSPLRYIFGINRGINWQELVVIFGIWIGFFILMMSVLAITPMLNKGAQKVFGSLIITSLVSITGGLNKAANILFNMAGFFSWVESWGPLRFIITIALAALIIFALNWFAKKVIDKTKLEEAKKLGEDIHQGRKSAQIMSRFTKKLGERK